MEDFEDKDDKMSNVTQYTDVIRLNVGGKGFSTSIATLKSDPNSMVCVLLLKKSLFKFF